MTRLVTALLTLVVMGLPAMAEEVAPGAQAAISEALAAIGCTVEADDVDATDDGYEADDAKCKDGEFGVTFDKDFKIKSKEKDEY
jgi:hypothetical protein